MRKRGEIEEERRHREWDGGEPCSPAERTETNTELSLEVLLDIRDLLQNPPVEKYEPFPHAKVTPFVPVEDTLQPERGPLFDEAVFFAKEFRKGTVITAHTFAARFQIIYARASALIDQLEAAGVITKKDKDGRRRVV